MKKLVLFLIFSILLATVSGCQAASPTGASSTPPVTTTGTVPGNTQIKNDIMYLPIIVDSFQLPYTTEELMDVTDELFTGKIVDISFSAFNFSGAMGDTSDPPRPGYTLKTTYEIEIQHSYMGECSGTVTFTVLGGIRDKYLDEQLALVDEYDMNGIHLLDKLVYPEFGKTYLFAFAHGESGLVRMTDEQYVFEINEDEIVEDPTVASYKSILDYLANLEQEENSPSA